VQRKNTVNLISHSGTSLVPLCCSRSALHKHISKKTKSKSKSRVQHLQICMQLTIT